MSDGELQALGVLRRAEALMGKWRGLEPQSEFAQLLAAIRAAIKALSA